MASLAKMKNSSATFSGFSTQKIPYRQSPTQRVVAGKRTKIRVATHKESVRIASAVDDKSVIGPRCARFEARTLRDAFPAMLRARTARRTLIHRCDAGSKVLLRLGVANPSRRSYVFSRILDLIPKTTHREGQT